VENFDIGQKIGVFFAFEIASQFVDALGQGLSAGFESFSGFTGYSDARRGHGAD
jgi:hypothetical protein